MLRYSRVLGFVAVAACAAARPAPSAAAPLEFDSLQSDPVFDTDSLVIETPDGEVAEPHPLTGGVDAIPLVYNQQVRQHIDYFQGGGRARFELWLRRSGAYIPAMEQILTEEGLPRNLVYLALIESGFSSHAYSRAAAVGYWQFIESTGKRYGLRIDDWVDERRDPIKATRAAARYLKRLHAKFGDWHLAAAGYNAGENKIARAIRRYGTENYWEIIKHRGYIKAETKQYVPKLIAAITIAENPAQYGFYPLYAEPLARTPVVVPGGADLTRLAYAAGITVGELRRLNPELRRWATPPGGDYELQLPPAAAAGFAARLATTPDGVATPFKAVTLERGETIETLALRHQVRIEDLRLLNEKARWRAGEAIVLPLGDGGLRFADLRMRPVYVTYKVRKGDTLSGIAKRHRVPQAAIKQANGLRSTRIRAGQTLRIPATLPGTVTARQSRRPK